MNEERLQIGIDFSKRTAHVAFYSQEGQMLEKTRAVGNSQSGYDQFRHMVCALMEAYQFDGINVSGEATSYLWLPFYLKMVRDETLCAYGLHTYLLNPREVKWFKKGFAKEHKNDDIDAFFIMERTRTRSPSYEWQVDPTWLGLRFYTRLRFHLVQNLVREKNYYQTFLFVINSSYTQHKPFNDTFGMTSSQILARQIDLDDLVKMDDIELAQHLHEMSGKRLREPLACAKLLRKNAEERFPLEDHLAFVIQRLLNLTMETIRFLEKQIKKVDEWIEQETKNLPQVQCLASIPGVGPVFSSGIAAEIGDLQRFLNGSYFDRKRLLRRQKTLKDAEASVAKIAGLWWPEYASGDYRAQDRRMAKSGNRYLRYYLIESADRMRQRIPDYHAYYHKKYAEVNKFQHKRALVLTARKSIGLIVGLLHRKEPYCSKEEI